MPWCTVVRRMYVHTYNASMLIVSLPCHCLVTLPCCACMGACVECGSAISRGCLWMLGAWALQLVLAWPREFRGPAQRGCGKGGRRRQLAHVTARGGRIEPGIPCGPSTLASSVVLTRIRRASTDAANLGGQPTLMVAATIGTTIGSLSIPISYQTYTTYIQTLQVIKRP